MKAAHSAWSQTGWGRRSLDCAQDFIRRFSPRCRVDVLVVVGDPQKGGKRHDVPAHHRAEQAVAVYVNAGGLDDPKAPLFQSVDRAGRLTGRPLGRRAVLVMIKRRAAAAGLPPSTCCHTFRATGITAYLSNGGTLDHAQQIAGHASPKTTKLYDRTADTISLDEIERIVI